MHTTSEGTHQIHGCEIVIPIVLKVTLYIEPVVIEQPPVCYKQTPTNTHPESHASQSKAQNNIDPVPVLAKTEVQPKPESVAPMASSVESGTSSELRSPEGISFTWLWRLLTEAY